MPGAAGAGSEMLWQGCNAAGYPSPASASAGPRVVRCKMDCETTVMGPARSREGLCRLGCTKHFWD